MWVREQALAIADSCSVVVLASKEAPAGRLAGAFTVAGARLEDGLQVVRVRFRSGRLPRSAFVNRLRGLAVGLSRLRGDGFEPDVVHAHVFSAGFPALLLGRRAAAPVVVSEHYSGFPLGLLSRWDRLIAGLTFRGADLVCPASDELGRHIAPLAGRTALRSMPNVVDTTTFSPDPDRASPDDRLRLLSVGALKRGKGHDDLLRAFAEVRRGLSRARLEIVGDGPLRSSLEALARDLGITGQVRFRGALTKDEVAAAMRSSHALVLPSLWENAPLAAIEALASGLPVLATRVGGVPEIVDAESGALVPPGDPSALADGMIELAGRLDGFDPAQLAERARRGWGHEAVGELWRRTYEDLLRSRARGGPGSP